MTDSSKPLYASDEKIKRARAKFEYLKSWIKNYVKSKPISVRRELHDDITYIIAAINNNVPIEIAWETVEAVGHLRSALDKMVIDLVDLNGRGQSGVGFPFGGLDENGKPRPFPDTRHGTTQIEKKLTADQWGFIVAQQPYPGGADILWAVNEIANSDKHRKGLVEVSASPKSVPFSLGTSIPKTTGSETFRIGTWFKVHPTDCDFVLKDKEREFVIMAFTNPDFNNQVDCTTTDVVAFGDIVPVQGKNVLVTLNQQIRLVDGIVDLCRTKFFK